MATPEVQRSQNIERYSAVEGQTFSYTFTLPEVNELKNELREWGERVKLLETRTKSLTLQLREDKLMYEASNESLSCEVTELKDKLVEFKKELKTKDNTVECLKSELDHLKGTVDDLERELNESKKGHDKLYISQAACLFEQAICSHVLPEVFVNDDTATLKDLLNYLNDEAEHTLPLDPNDTNIENILCEARQRWCKLCEDLNLPDEWKTKKGKWKFSDRAVPCDIRAITLLTRNKVTIAHPRPVRLSVKSAEEKLPSIKETMPSWQFELVENFIGSLREKILKSGLDQKQLKLDTN